MSDIEKIKQLRQSTGAGFKDCNNALKESEGNLEKASEILRVKVLQKHQKKCLEMQKKVQQLCGDKHKTSIIEINCETDFVAKNNDFIDFARN